MNIFPYLNGLKHKISDFYLYEIHKVIMFPHISSFRNKFDFIHVRILKTGLDVKWLSGYYNANKISKSVENDEFEFEDQLFPTVLKTIVIYEIMASCIVLIFECFWHYGLKKMLKVLKIAHYFEKIVHSKVKQEMSIRIHVQPREVQITSV